MTRIRDSERFAPPALSPASSSDPLPLPQAESWHPSLSKKRAEAMLSALPQGKDYAADSSLAALLRLQAQQAAPATLLSDALRGGVREFSDWGSAAADPSMQSARSGTVALLGGSSLVGVFAFQMDSTSPSSVLAPPRLMARLMGQLGSALVELRLKNALLEAVTRGSKDAERSPAADVGGPSERGPALEWLQSHSNLPPRVLCALRAGQKPEPEIFDDCTIVFAGARAPLLLAASAPTPWVMTAPRAAPPRRRGRLHAAVRAAGCRCHRCDAGATVFDV